MAETLSTRFQARRWSDNDDSPDRAEFDGIVATFDQHAAADTGETYTALPVSTYGALTAIPQGARATVKPNSDPYIYEYRRNSAGQWVAASNADAGTRYFRGATGVSSTSRAWETSAVDLANPTGWALHRGGARLGGLVTVHDTNTAANTGLYVGTADALDVDDLGRLHVRTIADGDKGVVAQSHGSAAGSLYAARYSGQDIWTVGPTGRMQSRAPSAFGLGVPTDGVALVSSATADGVAGSRFYGNTTPTPDAPALQAFGHVGDADPLFDVRATSMGLGKAGWAGTLSMLAANMSSAANWGHTGPFTVDGNAGVTGALTVLGGAAVTGALTAEGGTLASGASGGTTTLTTAVKPSSAPAQQQSLRQTHIYKRGANPGSYASAVYPAYGSFDLAFSLMESGWIRVLLDLSFLVDNGAAGVSEMSRGIVKISLRNAANDTELEAMAWEHRKSIWNYAPSAFREDDVLHIDETFHTRRSAGTYTLRVHHCRTTVLGHQIEYARLTVEPVVLTTA